MFEDLELPTLNMKKSQSAKD